MSFLMFLCHVHPICFIVETEQKIFMWGGREIFKKREVIQKGGDDLKKVAGNPFQTVLDFS